MRDATLENRTRHTIYKEALHGHRKSSLMDA
jgi:hypothetical protein